MNELCDAVKALSSNKAAGPDNQPVEFWKAVLLSDAGGLEGRQWLLDLCNQTWFQQEVPNAWHLQQVAVIYKKGDPADCGNYRPICLLNAAYKIFAMILLRREIMRDPIQVSTMQKHKGRIALCQEKDREGVGASGWEVAYSRPGLAESL
jgi:hypothetical protein